MGAVAYGPTILQPLPVDATEVSVLTWDNKSVSLTTAIAVDATSKAISFTVPSVNRYKIVISKKETRYEYPVDLTDDAILNPFPQYRRSAEFVTTVSASGATVTVPEPSLSRITNITLTANCTLTFPTVAAGKTVIVQLVQDATGSRTVTWPTAVKWVGGTTPTLSTVAGRVDLFSFTSIDGTTWANMSSLIGVR